MVALARRGSSRLWNTCRINKRSRLIWGFRTGAAVVLIPTAGWLPWATFQDPVSHVSLQFTGGPLWIPISAVALFVIALSFVQMAHPVSVLARTLLATSMVELVLAILLALTKISLANSTPFPRSAQTSYGFGAGLGVLAAAVMVTASAISLNDSPDAQRASAPPREDSRVGDR